MKTHRGGASPLASLLWLSKELLCHPSALGMFKLGLYLKDQRGERRKTIGTTFELQFLSLSKFKLKSSIQNNPTTKFVTRHRKTSGSCDLDLEFQYWILNPI